MQNNKIFCILPFVHSCIRTNGDITLCCHSREKSQYNIKTSTVDQWWNSDYLATVKNQMLLGQRLTECTTCYNVEDRGFVSARNQKNKEYKILQIKHADKILTYLRYDQLEQPIDIEIQLTNLCNLKCIMCNEVESSAILTENKKLQIAVYDQDVFNWNVDAIDKLKDLFETNKDTLINIRGGEPFMVPQIKEILQHSISTGSAEHIMLHITTNCTKFDSQWVNILDKFKQIRIMCSLDAVGNLSEYIRYNSHWPLVEENISLMRTIKDVNIVVNATVQNLNLIGLPQLITWCQKENLFLLLNILEDPRYLQIDVLPSKLLEQALELLVTAKNELTNPAIIVNLDNLIDKLSQTESKYQLPEWHEFLRNINLRESIRLNSLTTVIPELEEYINA